MVMSATSLSDVSLIAIVPESAWRMPTLIGPLSSAAAGAGAAAGAAAGAVAGASAGLSHAVRSVPIDVTAKRTLIELRIVIFTSRRFMSLNWFLSVLIT